MTETMITAYEGLDIGVVPQDLINEMLAMARSTGATIQRVIDIDWTEGSVVIEVTKERE